MTDRTTCYGCANLMWVVTSNKNVYFYCQHNKTVVGKLKPRTNLRIKPRPPHDKKCKWVPYVRKVKNKKKKSIFARFLSWAGKKWGAK